MKENLKMMKYKEKVKQNTQIIVFIMANLLIIQEKAGE